MSFFRCFPDSCVMRDACDYHLGSTQEFLTRHGTEMRRKGGTDGGHRKGFSLHYGAKKVCPRNPELNLVVVTCITHHATIWQTPKKKNSYYVMSIRHACHTSHSRKTPKVQNSSSKFKITRCHMGPYTHLCIKLSLHWASLHHHVHVCQYTGILASLIFFAMHP